MLLPGTTYSISIVAAGSQTALAFLNIWHWLSVLELINNGSCQFIVFANHIARASVLAGTLLVLTPATKLFVDQYACQKSMVRAPSGFSHLQDSKLYHHQRQYCFPFGRLDRCDTIVYFSFFQWSSFQGPSLIAAVLPSWNCVWMKLAAPFCILQTFGH